MPVQALTNIPVSALSKRGVVVFNAPGANANAVKELVLAAMLMSARNLVERRALRSRGCPAMIAALHKLTEDGKKNYVGFELPARSLGVYGAGCHWRESGQCRPPQLGLDVLGYDPAITVQNAWQLNASVHQAASVDDLISRSQFVSVHVPLLDGTRHLINAERLKLMKKGGILLNFARAEIVDEAAVVAALNAGTLHAYACDFPSNQAHGSPTGHRHPASGRLHW